MTGLNRKEEALWLFQRLAPGVAVDNQPLAIRTTAPLDRVALESAAAEILRRHGGYGRAWPWPRSSCGCSLRTDYFGTSVRCGRALRTCR